MNKEEIEELKEFTIDLTDIDELALGLEVCSKKSNMVIQEFAKLIIELEQQNQKYKEVIDKATNELFILKDMIYKPETREENFEIQRKISSIIKRLNGKEVE